MAVPIGIRSPYYADDSDPTFAFANRYGLMSIDVSHENDRFGSYSAYATYDINIRSTVNMSLPMTAFRNLVENDERARLDHDEQYYQHRMRAKYPALQDAWDKYQTLLTLMGNRHV
jgi:hypothetical protein